MAKRSRLGLLQEWLRVEPRRIKELYRRMDVDYNPDDPASDFNKLRRFYSEMRFTAARTCYQTDKMAPVCAAMEDFTAKRWKRDLEVEKRCQAELEAELEIRKRRVHRIHLEMKKDPYPGNDLAYKELAPLPGGVKVDNIQRLAAGGRRKKRHITSPGTPGTKRPRPDTPSSTVAPSDSAGQSSVFSSRGRSLTRIHRRRGRSPGATSSPLPSTSGAASPLPSTSGTVPAPAQDERVEVEVVESDPSYDYDESDQQAREVRVVRLVEGSDEEPSVDLHLHPSDKDQEM